MLTRAMIVLVAAAVIGTRVTAQEAASVGDIGQTMGSAQRCRAARDAIDAANLIRSCSDYTISVANGMEGRTQSTLLSASYALDSLGEWIETGKVAATPSVTHSAFARTQYALSRAHADAARDRWVDRDAAGTGRELHLSVDALTASLAERNRRADVATAAKLQRVIATADSLDHSSGYDAGAVVHAFIDLRTALMIVEPK